MFLTEYLGQAERKVYNWQQFTCYELTHTYKNEYASEIKTYKLTEKELKEYLKLPLHEKEEYLKKFNK